MNKIDKIVIQLKDIIEELKEQLDKKFTQEDRAFIVKIGKKEFKSRIPMSAKELKKFKVERSDIIKRILKKTLKDYLNNDPEAFDIIGSLSVSPNKKHYQFSAASKTKLIAPKLDKNGKKITSIPFDKSAYVESQSMWSSAEIYNKEEDVCPELKALNDEIRAKFGVK